MPPSMPIGEMFFGMPSEIGDFLASLTPDDVGREEFDGGWVVRFEGFSDLCLQDVDERLALPPGDPRHLPSQEAVYAEVLEGWKREEGADPSATGFSGDEGNPAQWAAYRTGEAG